MKKVIFLLLTVLLIPRLDAQENKDIIYLSWDNVVNRSLNYNLSLKSKQLDYENQKLEYWKSWSNFLPTLSYQGLATKNVELPVFVFQGQTFTVGTKYTFQHTLNLSLPLFTGGSRWFNMNAQSSLRKSLSQELKGKKEETVLNGLQNYYSIILAKSLLKNAKEASDVAQANLKQVQSKYDAGTATELDLQRAKAQYYSTLPKLESAKSNLVLANQQMKSFLNIPLKDSLVITDSLMKKEFLSEYDDFTLGELKDISKESREDLQALKYQLEATEEGEKLALSSFSPQVSISANVQHQAPMETQDIAWEDYIRSKAITLNVNWPLFEGGRKIVDYQKAVIQTDKAKLMMKQLKDQADLSIEQSFYKFKEAIKNLNSLKAALEQAKESLRISNLLYEQGMSTQLDVLNAQLLYTSSKSDYLNGIYNFNVSQLNLLKSIGKLDIIWE
jgi:outer membrane protein TolC